MKPYLISYLAAIVAFLVIDGLWLGVIARSFYANGLANWLRPDVLILPAAGFYLCYTAGLVFLAVRPDQSGLSLLNVGLYGAVVGFLAYGTYDMTNLSTLRDWPAWLSFIDLLWGTVLSASVAIIARIALRIWDTSSA